MRRVTVPITEYDIELFQELIDGGISFTWTLNDTIVEFVRQEGEEQ